MCTKKKNIVNHMYIKIKNGMRRFRESEVPSKIHRKKANFHRMGVEFRRAILPHRKPAAGCEVICI